MVMSIAFGSATSADPSEDRESCINEVVNAAGQARESPGIDMQVGKLAKKLYMADHPNFSSPRRRSGPTDNASKLTCGSRVRYCRSSVPSDPSKGMEQLADQYTAKVHALKRIFRKNSGSAQLPSCSVLLEVVFLGPARVSQLLHSKAMLESKSFHPHKSQLAKVRRKVRTSVYRLT